MAAKKPKREESITQIYDKIFKRILTLSNVAVVNFINGAFDKNFPTDSKLTYNWTENVKNSLEKTIADTIITVNDTEKFHAEVQIENDNTMVLRVFDYGYQDALKYKKIVGDRTYNARRRNYPDSAAWKVIQSFIRKYQKIQRRGSERYAIRQINFGC